MGYHCGVTALNAHDTCILFRGIGGWIEHPLYSPHSMDEMVMRLLVGPLSGTFMEPNSATHHPLIPF